MENEFAKHEKDYIKIYESKGYDANFFIKDGTLINSATKKESKPDDVYIVAQHRYEGMSDPSDMSILYIIETSHNEKGTFLAAYGPTADSETAEFFNKIPDVNISDEENINK